MRLPQLIKKLLPLDPGLAKEYLQFIVDYQMIQKSDVAYALQVEETYPALASFAAGVTICSAEPSILEICSNEGLSSIIKARNQVILSVPLAANTTVITGGSIVLKPGFQTTKGQEFSAKVMTCE